MILLKIILETKRFECHQTVKPVIRGMQNVKLFLNKNSFIKKRFDKTWVAFNSSKWIFQGWVVLLSKKF